ncbi:hypothetical protein DFH08DRAFT_460046 [Mycena albidolilacea]|uniref:PHD-type domain-containing protein n=1 Tax=Mycena albidolilacea TaxID=1033008 RepID=A0AAD7AEC7_9AGAR|nr:hypothetical protein DFH08DRAFT_460046 [Mycena albidolilacea]
MSAQVPRADPALDVFSQSAQYPVPNPSPDSQRLLSSPSDGGMPAFPQGRTHLPTPQSPDYMGQYINFQTPESPLAHASYTGYSAMGRPVYGMSSQNPMTVSSPLQTLTPETSPYTPRFDSRYSLASAIPPFNPQFSVNFATPRAASSSTTLPSPTTATKPPPFRMTTPPPTTPSPANLSSPFLDKLTIAGQTQTPQRFQASARPTSTQIPVHIPDIFSSSTTHANHSIPRANPLPVSSTSSVQISTPPISPTPGPAPQLPLAAPTPVAGGEMERIRQAMMQNQLAQHQEAEARRPDYLRRNKRPLSDTDPSTLAEDEGSRRPGVGIMDSPHKGRRITLFQETSDESFEESLMAGGYGRYRTADWVRQPQPMAPTPVPSGPSTTAKRPEAPTPPRPPTEKELRKRKRLEAFRSNETTNTSSDAHTSKLFPVNLATMGRVLIDSASDENGFAAVADSSSPSKNGAAGGKRAMAAANKKATKKKTQEPSAREKKMAIAAAALEDATEKPNWPDAEFPWRLRSEERAGITKEEEEQRMQLIEKFLDRDTDNEEGSDEEDGKEGEEDLLDPSDWGKVYEDATQPPPIPTRGGRGKMVQLLADPHVDRPVGGVKRSRFFPSDPGDARAALLAKKRVRSLSFRQQRRQRLQGADNDEVLCICRGKYDEEGDVVQCDSCGIWYHLHCIGIHSIKDLGHEDDPWYCQECYVVERSESSEEEDAPEPTFAPTDNEPRVSRASDTPLYQPVALLQESPLPWSGPKTPPRSSSVLPREFGSAFSSVASSSRHEPFTPSTPRTSSNRRRSVQVFGHDTPGGFDMDDLPFDPTSTPSRGIKFGAPFATPKNMWPVRPNGLFETPSKRRDSSSRLFGAPGTLDESASSSGGGGVLFSSPFGRMPTYDDSPIRRDTAPADAPRARRLLESPIAPSVGRYLGHVMTLEDSPVMWSTKGKARAHEAP